MSALQTMFRGSFLFGLPDTEVDQALLWFPNISSVRRKGPSGDNLFPSWSWAGSVGPVYYSTIFAHSCVKWKDAVTKHFLTSDEFRRPDSKRGNSRWYRKTLGGFICCRGSTSGRYPNFYETGHTGMLFLHPVGFLCERQKKPIFLRDTGCLTFRALSCSFSSPTNAPTRVLALS